MLSWIMENLATIIICIVLAAVIALIIKKMINDKKEGKKSCGCGCNNCPSAGMCHQYDQYKKQ